MNKILKAGLTIMVPMVPIGLGCTGVWWYHQPAHLDEATLNQPVHMTWPPTLESGYGGGMTLVAAEPLVSPEVKRLREIADAEQAKQREVWQQERAKRRAEAAAAQAQAEAEATKAREAKEKAEAPLRAAAEAATAKANADGTAAAERFDLTSFKAQIDKAAADGEYSSALRYDIPMPEVPASCSTTFSNEGRNGLLRCALGTADFDQPGEKIAYYQAYAAKLAERLHMQVESTSNCAYRKHEEAQTCTVFITANWAPAYYSYHGYDDTGYSRSSQW